MSLLREQIAKDKIVRQANGGKYPNPTNRKAPVGKRLPFHVIVAIMKKSSEGGRGTCHCCREGYSMKFLLHVKIDNFTTSLVCRVCQKEHNFTRL